MKALLIIMTLVFFSACSKDESIFINQYDLKFEFTTDLDSVLVQYNSPSNNYYKLVGDPGMSFAYGYIEEAIQLNFIADPIDTIGWMKIVYQYKDKVLFSDSINSQDKLRPFALSHSFNTGEIE